MSIGRPGVKIQPILTNFIEALDLGVLLLDDNREPIVANSAIRRIIGESVDQVDLKTLLKFLDANSYKYRLLNKKTVSAAANKALLTATRTKKSARIEQIPLYDKVYEIVFQPILDRQNNYYGTAVLLRDVTNFVAVDQMKTDFVSLASHQLKTPLASLNWDIEYMLSGEAGKISKEQRVFLEEMYGEIKGLIRLVNDLLNMSSWGSGRIRIDNKPTQVELFLKGIINEFKPLLSAKNATINLHLPNKKLPKIMLDPTLMRQAVHNLIANAIQYSFPRNNEIKIDLLATVITRNELLKMKKDLAATKKIYLLLSVKDYGIGIPKKAQPFIFEKFFRADNAVQVAAKGYGLGLHIVKTIVESAGGFIWFHSVPNRGTTFYIALPAHQTDV